MGDCSRRCFTAPVLLCWPHFVKPSRFLPRPSGVKKTHTVNDKRGQMWLCRSVHTAVQTAQHSHLWNHNRDCSFYRQGNPSLKEALPTSLTVLLKAELNMSNIWCAKSHRFLPQYETDSNKRCVMDWHYGEWLNFWQLAARLWRIRSGSVSVSSSRLVLYTNA